MDSLQQHQSHVIEEEDDFTDLPVASAVECRRCNAALTDVFLTLFRNLFQTSEDGTSIENRTDSLCGTCNDELQRFLNGEELDPDPELFRGALKDAFEKGKSAGNGKNNES